MANATELVNHIKLFGYKIQTTLFFRKKVKKHLFYTDESGKIELENIRGFWECNIQLVNFVDYLIRLI